MEEAVFKQVVKERKIISQKERKERWKGICEKKL